MKARRTILMRLAGFLVKIPTAIVSGLPRKKLLDTPVNKSILHTMDVERRSESEKHYHRPVAKPVVEKQTLLKEKKKAKAVH
jgi:hypothetical protein